MSIIQHFPEFPRNIFECQHSLDLPSIKYIKYRPQRSCGQGNIFAPVCHSVHKGGVCLSACWDTAPPLGADTPRADTPWEQTQPQNRHPLQEQTPPGADTPWSRHPLEQTPPGADTPQSRHPKSRHPPPGSRPPRSRHPPEQKPPPKQTPPGSRLPPVSRHLPREADSGIQSMSGRYASYWNAFLFNVTFGHRFPRFLHTSEIINFA